MAAVGASRSGSAASSDAVYAGLFTSSFVTMVRLATLIGADDPEDVAQEAGSHTGHYLRSLLARPSRQKAG